MEALRGAPVVGAAIQSVAEGIITCKRGLVHCVFQLRGSADYRRWDVGVTHLDGAQRRPAADDRRSPGIWAIICRRTADAAA
ncbi:MAG: hypothetical protein U0521_02020 [Anaerolineae bacterium]